jgi:hypothetical protein
MYSTSGFWPRSTHSARVFFKYMFFNNKAVVYDYNLWDAVFHVPHGPRPQDAETSSNSTRHTLALLDVGNKMGTVMSSVARAVLT